jgi:hypothetical protein
MSSGGHTHLFYILRQKKHFYCIFTSYLAYAFVFVFACHSYSLLGLYSEGKKGGTGVREGVLIFSLEGGGGPKGTNIPRRTTIFSLYILGV